MPKLSPMKLKKNIDAATTNAEVDQVKTDGITEVNGVNPQPKEASS